MCKYLHEQANSDAENLDMPPLSDDSNVQGRSQRLPGGMSKADINANTPSKSTIAYQSVKSRPAAKPADSIMSTPTNGAPATAASAATAVEMDSIADTDTTDTTVSGAGQAGSLLIVVTLVTFESAWRIARPLLCARSTPTSILT